MIFERIKSILTGWHFIGTPNNLKIHVDTNIIKSLEAKADKKLKHLTYKAFKESKAGRTFRGVKIIP
jgi:hypothetical protein